MTSEQMSALNIFKYKFAVPIGRPAEAVWSLMSGGINEWWMNDFRALGEGSVVSLDTRTGGVLLEEGANGEALEWYRVQMSAPGKSLYLVGYMAPDWGGPTISMLKLALEPKGESCILEVSDALLGNTSESAAKNAEGGWRQLFGDGLRKYAEA